MAVHKRPHSCISYASVGKTYMAVQTWPQLRTQYASVSKACIGVQASAHACIPALHTHSPPVPPMQVYTQLHYCTLLKVCWQSQSWKGQHPIYTPMTSMRHDTCGHERSLKHEHCWALREQAAVDHDSAGCPHCPCLPTASIPGCDRPSENDWAPQIQGQGMPHKSNVELIQSTGALSKIPGRPRQGGPAFWGRACAMRGDAGAVIPCGIPRSRKLVHAATLLAIRKAPSCF